MRVQRLRLQDFRNYVEQEVAFAPGITLVTGANAQGKTNLLEAVHCLTGLGSPRAADPRVIRSGAERAVVIGDVQSRGRDATVALEFMVGRGTRCLLNGTPLPGVSALAEVVTSVFFGPDDLLLIKGSPEGRRRFVDDLVVKLRPARAAVRSEWERVLRQRNALLKSAPRDLRGDTRDTLDVWTDALCDAGAKLTAARLETLSDLAPYARKRFEEIAAGGTLEVSYASQWLGDDETGIPTIDQTDIAVRLRTALDQLSSKEIDRGVTLSGPHRDDIAAGLSSSDGASLMDARLFASQGDQRSAALALRLAEYDLLAEAMGTEPILLLDDVFSELDPHRRKWLSDAVRSGQTIISSAEPDAATAARADLVIEVTEGRARAR